MPVKVRNSQKGTDFGGSVNLPQPVSEYSLILLINLKQFKIMTKRNSEIWDGSIFRGKESQQRGDKTINKTTKIEDACVLQGI